jgi:CRP/FNR family transcriptional regulator, cyclic AMP receptor protein
MLTMSLLRQAVKESRFREYFHILRRGVWFGRLPEATADALFSVGTIAEYNPNEMIYSEDVQLPGLLALIEGAVHFEAFDRSGRRILVCSASPGTWFGDITGEPNPYASLTARTFHRASIWHAPASTLRRMLREDPSLAEGLNDLNAGHTRRLIEMMLVTQRPTALAQVAGRLALIDRFHKENDCNLKRAVVHMNQADLADMTGRSRQTVNVIVSQLEKEQLIRIGHRRIEILDPEGLDSL